MKYTYYVVTSYYSHLLAPVLVGLRRSLDSIDTGILVALTGRPPLNIKITYGLMVAEADGMRVAIDNGAYTYWSSNNHPPPGRWLEELDRWNRWLDDRLPGLRGMFFLPDKIPSHYGDWESIMLTFRLHRRYLYKHYLHRGLCPVPVVHGWDYDSTMWSLREAMRILYEYGSNCRTIAFGGYVPAMKNGRLKEKARLIAIAAGEARLKGFNVHVLGLSIAGGLRRRNPLRTPIITGAVSSGDTVSLIRGARHEVKHYIGTCRGTPGKYRFECMVVNHVASKLREYDDRLTRLRAQAHRWW